MVFEAPIGQTRFVPNSVLAKLGHGLSSVPWLNEQVCPKTTLDLVLKNKRDFQGYVGCNDEAATVHDNTAGTVFDPGTRSLEWPQLLSGTVDVAVGMEVQTGLARIPRTCLLN